MATGLEIQRVVDEDALVAAAAGLFARLARKGVADSGRFGVALCGGRATRGMFDMLAGPPFRDRVSWDRVEVFRADERAVADWNIPVAREAVLTADPPPALDLVMLGLDDVLPPAIVNRARCVACLAAGEDQAERLAEVLEGPPDPDRLPSQRIRPESGRLVWLVDRAASARLEGREAARVRLAPSILAADFARLGEQVAETARAGADRVHVDVMDGHFVPNISIGPGVIKSLRRATPLPLETHLMITDPDRYAEAFTEAGSDRILYHQEVSDDPVALATKIRALGASPGIVINPETPAAAIEPIIAHVDLALVMTVHPGFGGQKFIEDMLPKIAAVRDLIDRENPTCDLEVDGGIDARTVGRAVEAGARVLVAGSAVFGHADGIAAAMTQIGEAAARSAPAVSKENG